MQSHAHALRRDKASSCKSPMFSAIRRLYIRTRGYLLILTEVVTALPVNSDRLTDPERRKLFLRSFIRTCNGAAGIVYISGVQHIPC